MEMLATRPAASLLGDYSRVRGAQVRLCLRPLGLGRRSVEERAAEVGLS